MIDGSIDGVFLQLFSLLYMLALSFIYFKRVRIKTPENDVFSKIIICNILGLIIHLMLYFFIAYIGTSNIMTIIISKLYLVYLITYMIYFTLYDIIISTSRIKRKTINILRVVFFLIFLFYSSLIFNLPEQFYVEPGKIYTYGQSITSVYIFSFVIISFNILLLLLHRKDAFTKKYSPLFIYILLGFFAMLVQYNHPYIQLMTAKDSFIILLIYFTIENPDVKMLDEFESARNHATKSNEEKQLFLFNITGELRKPLLNISNACDELEDMSRNSEMKKGLYYIENNSKSMLGIINNILDVSSMEACNIKVYDTKYDTNLLFKSIIDNNKSKVNEDTKLRVHIDDISPYLYGDSIRIKQVINTLLENSIKFTKKGYIELNVNEIIKNDISRLIITIEDSGTGIKTDEIEKIFDKENQKSEVLNKIDDTKENLAIAKTIATLLGGLLMFDSELSKGSRFTFILDQKIATEKSKELKKIETLTDKYINLKKVILISEDTEYMKKLTKFWKRYDVIIESVNMASMCLEKVREDNKYSLIVLDEKTTKLKPKDIINKLKDIPGFKTPVVILTDNVKNREYIDLGYKENISKKLPKKDIDNLMDNL